LKRGNDRQIYPTYGVLNHRLCAGCGIGAEPTLSHAVRLTTPEAVAAGRLPGDAAVTVTLVTPEAETAGLHVGDAMVDVNHRPFTGSNILLEELRHSRPKQPMSLTTQYPIPLTLAGVFGNFPIRYSIGIRVQVSVLGALVPNLG
jgi:hypothetical protein